MIGGAEMCLLDLLASFRTDRPEWSLKVILGDDGPLRAAVSALDVACEVLPFPPQLAALGDAGLGLGSSKLALMAKLPKAFAAAADYRAMLAKRLAFEAPDLVQTNGMKAHVLGAWAAPRGVPVVWHLHDYVSSRPLMARLLKWSSRRGVRVVAVSTSVAADAWKWLGPVETIHNAVDLDRFRPGPGNGPWLDAEAGLPTAEPGIVRVGLVATYAKWKGHEVFLEAVAKLPKDVPARFFIVGGPLYKSAGSQYSLGELVGLAAKLGVAGRIGFTGHLVDPAAVYRSLDVVVHASTKPEPFGRVIVEAMACGRAVLASRGGGAIELFNEGISAWSCGPGNSEALAQFVGYLIDDPDRRRSLGEAGRAEAVARFDRSRLAGEWARVYAKAGVRVTDTDAVGEQALGMRRSEA